tara:strand:- start:5271 stop:5687 length:417 start_codon:yes stop_codon:yes gene_type:complete
MATMTTTFSASATFTLTDSEGVVVFTYSPSFESGSNTTSQCLYTGEHLAQTGGSELALSDVNDDRVYVFIKNVDSDYPVEIEASASESSALELADLKPGECFFAPMELNGDGTGSSIQATASTADQHIQYLICDALDN